MEQESPQDLSRFQPILTSAERILSEAQEQLARLGETELLSDEDKRNVLLRCRNLSSKSRATYIIKQVVADKYNPENIESWDVRRFLSDWAGAQFLSELNMTPAAGPRFYGGDRALGFFVIEDLGPHRSLVQPILEETAPSAQSALRTFAAALGRLHAGAAGHTSHYLRICGNLHSKLEAFSSARASSPDDANKVTALLDQLMVPVGSHAVQEMLDARAEIDSPGPFLTFIHGDPCPDNTFFIDDHMYLIDFEFAHFGHALLDGVYGRIMFPTCWCCNRLPSTIVDVMETAYRAELVRGIPEAADDRIFGSAIVGACAHWTIRALAWHLETALNEDQEWGIATLRPRVIARLEAFIATSEAYGRLPALRDTMSRVLDVVRKKWPEAAMLPLYPAFRD